MELTGETKLTGIIGYPVAHTLSPAMHNAAFEALGLNFCYLPFSVRPRDLPAALAGFRTIGCRGLNVTIPHKQAVVPLMDALSREARLMKAVNTIEFRGTRMIGHNTDGRGFVRAFAAEFGKKLKGRNVLLLGAGGAARAVAVQLLIERVEKLVIGNRSARKGARLVRDLENAFPGQKIKSVPLRGKGLGETLQEIEIVINATPLGMKKGDPSPLPRQYLGPGLIVSDLVYRPGETRLLREARRSGARTQNGLGMLLYQGALAFEIWTGRKPDLNRMKRALLQELTG